MNDLNDMLVFATVVEQGSFTSAAEVLGTPKSNISRKITRLEQYLGVRLLERSTRTQNLTEVGRQYYRYCQRIKEEVISAETAVETLLEKPQGRLRLCVSVGVGQALLTPLLTIFCQQYPEIELDITLANRRVDIIEEGFDLVIRVGELSDSGLIAKKLLEITLSLYASPEYQNKEINQPGDLLEHPLLLMSAKERKPVWSLISGGSEVKLAFKPLVRADDFLVLKQLSSNGVGITELPDYMATDLLESGQLIRVLESWQFEPVNLYAIYPSHRGATPKVRAMVDYLSQALA
ncbi:LysR family transcriptional regulator [Endozoicomonas arenosclerae]|uniref:LysR family transcriptional regulator n=1 Tax=Endozoicomonas arenosclerae TaxID=1633495 RepID=UPI000A9EC059|nr:LysR family transcriptional regulator [Endozoicomonas arenosclerae]